jgi:hypothetical protein
MAYIDNRPHTAHGHRHGPPILFTTLQIVVHHYQKHIIGLAFESRVMLHYGKHERPSKFHLLSVHPHVGIIHVSSMTSCL